MAPWFSRSLVVLVCALAVVVGLAGIAIAQDAPAVDAQAEARRLFEEGRAHADAERWPDAVTSFERSRALLERPSTLFNLASALVRVGRAIETLAVLATLERVADPRRDRAILAGVAELRTSAEASIRHVVLTIAPETAALEVDGQPIEGSGATRSLTLDPGAHAASVSLAGFATERIDIALGVDALSITLRPRLARVHVVPSLTSAEVLVDGTSRGLGEVDVELEPGTHRLEVTASGHEPLVREVDVAPGAELTVAADLVEIAPPVTQSDVPLIVGLTIGGVVLVAGIATVLGVLLGGSTEAPSGGTTNVVVAVPLTSPMVRF